MNVAALLAALALHVPVPAGVQFVAEPCPALQQLRVNCVVDHTVYLAPQAFANGQLYLKLNVAHEIGHIWDAENLDDQARARYATLVGLADTWFFPNEQRPAGYVPAGEQFADAYALCAIGPRVRRRFAAGRSYLGLYGEWIPRQIVADTCWLLHHPPA